jgi:hypothetical protein
MEHRHLDISPGEWGVAVVESIWERGSDQDILGLLREVRRNPNGPASAAVRRALPRSSVYGYPAMFKLLLEAIDERS